MHEQGGWVHYRITEMGHNSGRGEALVLTWRGAGANMSELGAELGWSPDMEASAGAGWDGGWRGWKQGQGGRGARG